MFGNCKSLTNINLSNFNTNKNVNMTNIILGCVSLKKDGVITYNDEILKQLI